MKSTIVTCALLGALMTGLIVASVPARAAAAEAPKVSTFAPADDLVGQLDEFLASLAATVKTEEEFKQAPEGKVTKEANTVILIALALGLHDSDNKYKAPAAGIIAAAREVAAAKDYAAIKAAVDKLQAAAGTGPAGALKWEKLASLDQVMKEVPVINTKMKRHLAPKNFKKKTKDLAVQSAALAVIAQGSIADTSKAKDDAQVKQWADFCVKMRDTAGELNKAIHAGDQAAATAANKRLAQSCDDCHAVFKPEEKGKK